MMPAGSIPTTGVVLVVTPPDPTADDIGARLGQHGRAVSVVESATEAMRRVATEPCVGAIVSDALKEPPAVECIGALRILAPDLPVILLTRSGDADSIVEALHAGADAYVADGACADVARVLAALLGRVVEMRASHSQATGVRESDATYTATDLGDQVRRTAHDMNQPLTVIFGLVDVLMLDASEDQDVRDDLLTLQREAERLRVMARSLVHLGTGSQAAPRDPEP